MRQRCANCGWLSVNPSGAVFCGYSDERTWEDESCMAWKDKDEPQTNADLYRSYSDEQLAELFNQIETEGRAYGPRGKNAWLDWLKQEVSKNG